jgi:hypothetical protein
MRSGSSRPEIQQRLRTPQQKPKSDRRGDDDDKVEVTVMILPRT